MPEKTIDRRLSGGKWQPIHRGVYATFSGPVGRGARLWAALLYAGPGARLSHQTAAELLRLAERRDARIHVKIPANRHVVPSADLVLHRTRVADPGCWFPAGTPPHTLAEETVIDLIDSAGDLDMVVGWVTAGFGKRLISENRLREEMARRKRLQWRSLLDEIIAAGADGSHSILEYRYDRDVAGAHGLPTAVRQFKFRKPDGTVGYRDRYYAEYKLVVELDGKQAHPDERRGVDEDRDNHAAAVGGSTLRFGWADVTRKACESAAITANALRERGWRGELKPCSPGCRAVSRQSRALMPRG
jgi:hypothetical protein